MIRRLLLAAAALGALAALPGQAGAQATCTPRVADSELVRPRTLVMSTNPTLPPLQFVDAQGQLRGMRIELGTERSPAACA